MVGKADPLRLNVPLVGKDGVPTREFALFLNAVWRKVIAPDPEIPEIPPDPDYELIEDWPMTVEYAEDGVYVLILDQAVDREFIYMAAQCEAGNCTIDLYAGATPIASLDVTSTKDEVTFGVDTTAGQNITIEVSVASGVENLVINVHSRRVVQPVEVAP